LRRGHRQAGSGDRVQAGGGGHGDLRFSGVKAGEAGGGIARQRHQQGGRKQPGRFGQRQRGAVQIGRAIAQGFERAFHRHAQIVGGVGERLQPAKVCALGHRDTREIIIIGAGLQRFGAPRGQRKGQRPERGHRGQPGGGKRFDRRRQRHAPTPQHHRQAHAQIGAGAVQPFNGSGAQGQGGAIHAPEIAPRDAN